MVSILPIRHLRDEVLENLFALSRNQRLAHSHCSSRVPATGKNSGGIATGEQLDCECRIKSVAVYVGGPVLPPFPARPFYRAAKLGIRGEKAPVHAGEAPPCRG
ncbi:MAG: hypothetical protein DME93_01725 [Verrucomicrobia bacterium]|nr:MAG: hypothetical protein DME93_01725 [Verrucomicrobiota bacterium]